MKMKKKIFVNKPFPLSTIHCLYKEPFLFSLYCFIKIPWKRFVNLFLGKTNQGRMDDFFKTAKIVSTTKQTPKRKAGGKQKGNPTKKQKKK